MEKVTEGDVEIEVPEGRPYDREVFYNPKMRMDRNLSVVVASVVQPCELCDALSASGIRGIRYRKEAGVDEVWLNDANYRAVELIKENVGRNGLNCEIRNEDAAVLLKKKMFDYIDVDPFGSPAEFLDAAASSVKDSGFLTVTATDTSSFFGTYPRVSIRRYGRKSMKTDYNKELGLRILVSVIIESLGRYKKTFHPKLCYFREHYARVLGSVKEDATAVQENFRNFSFVSHCFSCGWRKGGLEKTCPNCASDTEFVEVYMGKLNDHDFCSEVSENAHERGFHDAGKLAEKLSRDMGMPYHYDLHYLSKKQSTGVPKTEDFVKALKEKGYEAGVSVYSPTGVKTNAPFQEVTRLLCSLFPP